VRKCHPQEDVQGQTASSGTMQKQNGSPEALASEASILSSLSASLPTAAGMQAHLTPKSDNVRLDPVETWCFEY
jgi:hypothetical protein